MTKDKNVPPEQLEKVSLIQWLDECYDSYCPREKHTMQTLHDAVDLAHRLADTTHEPHIILFIEQQYVVREYRIGDGLHPNYETRIEPKGQ